MFLINISKYFLILKNIYIYFGTCPVGYVTTCAIPSVLGPISVEIEFWVPVIKELFKSLISSADLPTPLSTPRYPTTEPQTGSIDESNHPAF